MWCRFCQISKKRDINLVYDKETLDSKERVHGEKPQENKN